MLKKTLLSLVCAALITVTAFAAEIGVVDASSGLKLRSSPSTTASVIVVVPDGTEVVVTSTQNGWCTVQYNGKSGYMSADYLTVSANATFTSSVSGTVTGSVVNVRAGASTTHSVVCTLNKGTVVTVSGVSEGWFTISYGNYSGYIHPDYLTISQTKNASASSSPSAATSNEPAPAAPETLSDLRSQVIEYAKTFIGSKYVMGGKGPTTFDCSGYIYYVFKNFGYTLNPGASAQMDAVPAIKKAELLPGDLVFFNNGSGRLASHVGIYLGDGDFIHAKSPGKALGIDSMTSGYYKIYYVGAGRVLPED